MLIAAVLLWMAALTGYDVRQRRLPNWLTLPGVAGVMLVATRAGNARAPAVGAGLLAALYLLVHVAAPAAMGASDVKLALGLGALTGCFGADVWLLAAVAAPLLNAVVGMVARVGWAAKTVAHGPSMCQASAAALG